MHWSAQQHAMRLLGFRSYLASLSGMIAGVFAWCLVAFIPEPVRMNRPNDLVDLKVPIESVR